MLRCFFRTEEALQRAGLGIITNGVRSVVEFVCSCCLSVSWRGIAGTLVMALCRERRLYPRFHQIINNFFAALIKEVVGGAYTGYSKKEAEWDSFLGVVRVTRRLEKIVMFVSGFCVQICVDSVVAEVYLYIKEG